MKGKLTPQLYNVPGRAEYYAEARSVNMEILILQRQQLAHAALVQNCSIKECCIMCGIKIAVQIYKGTGVCGELCRKDRDGDHAPARAISP